MIDAPAIAGKAAAPTSGMSDCARMIVWVNGTWDGLPRIVERMRSYVGIEIRTDSMSHADAVSSVDAVVCIETASTAGASTWQVEPLRARVPVIPVHVASTEIRIGPVWRTPDGRATGSPRDGCIRCAVLHDHDRHGTGGGPPWLDDGLSQDVADHLVVACCDAVDPARGAAQITGAMTCLDVAGRFATGVTVTPHPACALCFPPRADDARAGCDGQRWVERGQEAGPTAPPSLRDRLPELRRLTGPRFGVLETPVRRPAEITRRLRQFCRARGVEPDTVPFVRAHAFSVAEHTHRDGSGAPPIAEGFDFEDAARAEALAIIEGLERLHVLRWHDPRRVERLRLADAGPGGVAPEHCHAYLPDQRADPAFPLAPLGPDVETGWIHGWDLTGRAPCRVAVDLVVRNHTPDAVAAANSTGAACHTDVRRAIVNGILETVERDAFMLAWLLRRSMPPVASAAGDPDPGAIRASFARLDLDLACVDITSDLGIPTVLGVLRDRRDPDLLLVDMVADTSGRRAMAKLQRELAQFASHPLAVPGCLVNACTHDGDPDAVRNFPDHAAFYQRADRHALVDFLTASTETSRRDWVTVGSDRGPGEELAALVGCLGARGYRVVAVDCTPPLLRDRGLHAVKVLIPGLQPLHAGHRLRALGGTRLQSFLPATADAGALNPWPHPFW